MFKHFLGIIFSILLLSQTGTVFAASDPNDAEGCKDPAIFTRMTGFFIEWCEDKEFDRFEFPVTSEYKMEAVEGHLIKIQYAPKEGTKWSGLQVVRNYTNAALAIGGKKITEFEDGGIQNVTLKITKDNAEIWTYITAGGSGYNLYIVEKELMKQDVVADAGSLASSINSTGKASVYGIYFDTGKSDVKAESEPALQEIAKLLKADTKLKLYVVGHTDNVGTFSSNVTLSNSRADAVVKELVGKYSIAATRLQAFGAGPTAPVQSNTTEEGRAKNRRVELVAQ